MGRFLASLVALTLGRATTTAAESVAPVPLQPMQIGRVALNVPVNLQWRTEKGVLLGEPMGSDQVWMSISVFSSPQGDIGSKIVAAQARDAGVALQKDGSRVWYQQYRAPAPDSKEGAAIHDWFVGFEAHAVTITCVVDLKAVDSEHARAILASIPQIRKSMHTAQ
jgi:hypothetical protein